MPSIKIAAPLRRTVLIRQRHCAAQILFYTALRRIYALITILKAHVHAVFFKVNFKLFDINFAEVEHRRRKPRVRARHLLKEL